MKKTRIDFADGTTKEVKCSDEVYDYVVKIIKGEQGYEFDKHVRKKRKLVSMTNREFVKTYHKETLCKSVYGGIIHCPYAYGLEMQKCKLALENYGAISCAECYNLPAKRNGRWLLKEVKK